MPIKVNGELIPDEMIQQEIQRMQPEYKKVFAHLSEKEQEAQLLDWAKENVIERVLLRQAALEDPRPIPFGKVDEVFTQIKQARGGDEVFYSQSGLTPQDDDRIKQDIDTQLRIERITQEISSRAKNPKKADAIKYYEQNQEQFVSSETVKVSHIVKNVDARQTEEEARQSLEEVLEKINAGESFEDLANRYSNCPGHGGDLGYFPRGQMVQRFEDEVFKLKVNEVSPIFRTEFGFHIAKLYDKKPPAPIPFQQVEKQIIEHLQNDRKNKEIEKYLDTLKEKAKIEK